LKTAPPELYEYQKEGVRFMLERPGTLLADDLGVGKSRQAIEVINALPAIRRILVVCPATVRIHWRRELEKWLLRPLSIGVAGVDDVPDEILAKVNVLVINYDRLVQYRQLLEARVWGLAIYDEVHLLKTIEAKRSQVALRIQAVKRLALSGTPLPNRPIELFGVLAWLNPTLWPPKDRFRFALRYCGAVQTHFGWDLSGASHLDELRDRLRSTVMLRRTKQEVLPFLPLKSRTVVELFPEADLQKLLTEEWTAFRQFEATGASAESYSAKVKALKPVRLKAREHLALVRHKTALEKVPLCVEFITEALKTGSEKIIVFAHHRDVIAELDKRLGRFFPVQLVGGMTPLQKQKAIDQFQRDPACRVFLGNIKAAGIGIDLSHCSHVVFVELDWVPGNVTQAEDRAWRIGTRASVLVQHLVLAGSLDAVMARVLISKQAVLSEVLERTNRSQLSDG
jgi:SWI/SNF-related matrix-associated actin-dependent regulator 1 of chromatin subfamily A